MRQQNLEQLDKFLEIMDERVRTTRRASERFYESPSLSVAIEGERQIKATFDTIFMGFDEYTDKVAASMDPYLDEIKQSYWEEASSVTERDGATETSLEAYFQVSPERSEKSIRKEVREEYAADTVPTYFLDVIEGYSENLDENIVTSARIATTNLKHSLPSIKTLAQEFIDEGCETVEAGRRAFGIFAEEMVPAHIKHIKKKLEGGNLVSYNKQSDYIYDHPRTVGNSTFAAPLRLKDKDAKGIMSLYRLERRPYSDEELVLGDRLIKDPHLQVSLLMFQLAIVDYTGEYLKINPKRKEHSLLSFAEFFVPDSSSTKEEMKLLPNPRLQKILSNNLIPALAGVLINDKATSSRPTADQLREAVATARRRRVFQAQIGKFNNYDAQTDTVELDAIFNRTCPAMQVLTDSLSTWLPYLYEHCLDNNGKRTILSHQGVV